MIKVFNKRSIGVLFILMLVIGINDTYAQYDYKWINIGSLHSYYTAIGSEVEEGRVKVQQDGLQWPAIYKNQDMSAAKGFWIGCKSFKDESGEYQYRVVHVGPRVSGSGEFFPISMKLFSQDEPSAIFVDGNPSMQKNVEIDEVKPTLEYERLIENKINSLIGLETTRKVFGFSNQYHDNYIVSEYTFVNTGNTDADPEIERKDSTLRDVYIYLQWRLAPNKETRYIVGNGSGWGMNTMNDARGDGQATIYGDPANENFRTQFAWHGYWPSKVTTYNNIGAPIFVPDATGYVAKNDSIGRLGAPQFVGVLTLFASSPTNFNVDDPNQPILTRQESSDLPEFSGNDAYNSGKMTGEYKIMSYEHDPANRRRRHAYEVHPDAKTKGWNDFANQINDPTLGTPGGFSFMNSYGPYTIAYGDTVRIIIAEGAAGISRDEAIRAGKAFKAALNDGNTANDAAETLIKNQKVLTGKDSLMQTWRRAIANYNSGWTLSSAIKPPKTFNVNSGGDKVTLSWTASDDSRVRGYEIYRAVGQYDSTYYLIKTATSSENSYEDRDLVRGLAYYYYIVAVGDDQPADPALNIPAHTMKSSRYATQTFDPAYLKRPAGKFITDTRIVPNPFIISKDNTALGAGQNFDDRIMFYNIPGYCTIKIYTELGELIKTIEHNDGSGDAEWSSVTSGNQVLVSGIYIAVITDTNTGEKTIQKFVIIR